ncbi:MerR-like helix-turn-helix DNA binding domain protein [Gordonia phage MScarn]|uniref:MerR-like helix-turn-helix DNA binding domain protein n=2 Tax=Emalynvirus troje TaxID=2560511 RepID=A0A8F3IPQ6_9CAUD|nr:MerR-like helix-turn-helix DNA binding domain protein [Gordonia phage Buttrmlkdreams]QWY84906.1 MerR-like helix-turn-helix DNA binding domain protein [Gordonia phage MScarn]
MNTRSAANVIGITPKQLRSYLRSRTDLIPAPETGKQYELTLDQVEQVKKEYWELKDRFTKATDDWQGNDDPGMSLEDLANPSAREQFIALRRERAQRLDALMRKAGMSLGQMGDDRLLANGRILTLEAAE